LEAVEANHWSISLMCGLQDHQIICPLRDDYLLSISEGMVTPLCHYNTFDLLRCKVRHCTFHSILRIKVRLPENINSEAEADVFAIKDTARGVVLHKELANSILYLIRAPQIVVMIERIQICA
jgi:hypothetical protein